MKEYFGFSELISHTTRDKRKGETDGITYHYVNDEEFDELNKIEEVEYSGNRYALTKGEIDNKLKNNNRLFVIIDKKGIEQLKKIYNDKIKVIYVYSTPNECWERLKERDGIEEAMYRMNHAHNHKEFSNCGFADYILRSKDGKITKMIYQLDGIINYEFKGDI